MKMVSWLDKFAQDRSKINKMKKTAKKIIVNKDNFPTVKNDDIVEYENEKYKVVDSKFEDENGDGIMLEKCANIEDADPMDVEVGVSEAYQKHTNGAQEYANVDPQINDEDPRDEEVAKFEEEAKKTEEAINAENSIDGTKGNTRPNRIIQKMFETINVQPEIIKEPVDTEIVEPVEETEEFEESEDDMIDLEAYEFDEDITPDEDEEIVEAEDEFEYDNEKYCNDIKQLENEFKRCSNKIFNKLNK